MRKLAHVRFGDGPRALLLLHGFLGGSRNVALLGRGLAARDPGLTVVACDLTGHGDSPPLPPGADLATLAGDVLATAEALGLPRPLTLVGHSLGGRVALRACLRAPAAVAHATFLDVTPSARTPGGETARVVQALAGAPEAATREQFRAHFRAAGLADPVTEWLLLNLGRDGDAFRWRIDRSALASLYPRIGAEDLWAAVEGGAPYRRHCVRGARSDYVSEEDAGRLVAAGCRVDTIAHAGHFLHVERPAEVLERVAQGLR